MKSYCVISENTLRSTKELVKKQIDRAVAGEITVEETLQTISQVICDVILTPESLDEKFLVFFPGTLEGKLQAGQKKWDQSEDIFELTDELVRVFPWVWRKGHPSLVQIKEARDGVLLEIRNQLFIKRLASSITA